MAVQKLTKKGYGQLEINVGIFSRTGNIEAQMPLDPEEFPADELDKVAENGMLFAVDRVNKVLKKATQELAKTHLIGINYSAEHMYDPRLNYSYRNFALHGGEDFLPRIGFMTKGEEFHTNTVCYDTGTFAAETNLIEAFGELDTTPLYAGIASDGSGYWEITKTLPTAGPIAQVVEYATMPDGQHCVVLSIIGFGEVASA